MSDTIIRAEGLGKKYSIRHENREQYVALRDVFTNAASRLKQRIISSDRLSTPSQEDFWALQDISFEINRGDRIGIIGRNGAGKSTLLKILSRITEPTTGFVDLRGRVASLLEVGTGFHPELTGRENIFLNGAILGMSKAEISRKFDEIVAFSEVEKFLDTPVKRYSSGMYVRLAFAVAAHLEPEILIVDEVLAVGDAQFQKKCLGKMESIGKEGRTVVFVSHNMGAIEALCQKGMLIEEGQVVGFSDALPSIIRRYMHSNIWDQSKSAEEKQKVKTDYFEILDFELLREDVKSDFFSKEDNICLRINVNTFEANPSLAVGFALYDISTDVCLLWSFHVDEVERELPTGKSELVTQIPSALLNDGRYRIEFLAALHSQKWLLAPRSNSLIVEFEVQGGQPGSKMLAATKRPSLLLPIYKWHIEEQ